MNPDIQRLHPYPFERLNALKAGIKPPAELEHIALSIGEPRHPAPAFVVDALREASGDLESYPVALGSLALRRAAADWLQRRFDLGEDGIDAARQVVPVNGTREGIFALVQAVVDRRDHPLVLMPNPFYQIYEGATLLAGAEPGYLATRAEHGFLPDLDAVPAADWDRCQLLFLCSPGNPTGAVMDRAYLQRVIELADRHDFIIASDECYAEIYTDEAAPPPGLLEVCHAIGRDGFERCVVLHSLSKRSNVPGMRSGFVAGDAGVIGDYLRYRTYHGCAMPEPTQRASVVAWADDAHVAENRAMYRAKFQAAAEILGDHAGEDLPAGAFYLWLAVPGDEEHFVRELYAQRNLTILPGSYLSRPDPAGDPGSGRVRISLVPDVATCAEAMRRLAGFMDGYGVLEMDANRDLIESAFEARDGLSPSTAPDALRKAIATCLAGLESGQLRVAEPVADGWQVNEWLKKAVLLYFRINGNRIMAGGASQGFDKVPVRFGFGDEAALEASGARVVPPAVVRTGAFIGRDVVLMPSYVNIGAYVGDGSMIDTWATVGSCAQIGAGVHISGGAGIGGVLEPLQAAPTIIEDGCFIGARSEIVEGVRVERGAVVAMGVFIGASTRIYDRERDAISYGTVPAGAVVVPGSLPSEDGRYALNCAVIVKRVDERTRAKVGINELLRSVDD